MSSPEGIDFETCWQSYLQDRGQPLTSISEPRRSQLIIDLKARASTETSPIRDEVNGKYHWRNSLTKKPAIYDIIDKIAEELAEEEGEEEEDNNLGATSPFKSLSAATTPAFAAFARFATSTLTTEALHAAGLLSSKEGLFAALTGGLGTSISARTRSIVGSPVGLTRQVITDTPVVIEVFGGPEWADISTQTAIRRSVAGAYGKTIATSLVEKQPILEGAMGVIRGAGARAATSSVTRATATRVISGVVTGLTASNLIIGLGLGLLGIAAYKMTD